MPSSVRRERLEMTVVRAGILMPAASVPAAGLVRARHWGPRSRLAPFRQRQGVVAPRRAPCRRARQEQEQAERTRAGQATPKAAAAPTCGKHQLDQAPLEAALYQALPGGKAAGVVRRHAPQKRGREFGAHRLGLLGAAAGVVGGLRGGLASAVETELGAAVSAGV
jgi:hypothetical protein